jgi:hypothetical protein
MARYMILWETNINAIPTDLKERTATVMKFRDSTKQWLKENPKNDWGSFLGEMAGYAIVEGEWKDVAITAQQLYPYYKCKVHQIVSLKEAEELMKTIQAAAK